MPKLEVYLNEYNIPMGSAIYLPLVCGLLQAYAQTKTEIRDNYEFMPFIFLRDKPEQILSQYKKPAVAAFSCSMWNINLSLEVARQVKEKFPDCLIVFGGPQVPTDTEGAFSFFSLHPFVDVTVRGEGEHTFVELLTRFLDTTNFEDIPGIFWRNGRVYFKNEDRLLEENPDVFPSPYLEEVFDYLMLGDMDFHATVETNRGCPFKCTFCFWGRAEPYRFFSFERIQKIAEWCGRNRIKYVFCADSNFGMLKRDLEIAQYFVDAKAKYGFPKKFRATFGKNAEYNIYKIGKLLTEHDMEKGITLSTQSNDPKTLANVRRKNIKLEVYKNLQERYKRDNIPTYTELILGLPGETYKSFMKGMEESLKSGTQVFVHICQVYPNTELATKEYQQKFGIKAIHIPLNETHASMHSNNIPEEYEEIVICTATMSHEDWQNALVISWIMQLLHGLKLGVHILNYLSDTYHINYIDFFGYIAGLEHSTVLGNEVLKFKQLASHILDGEPRGCIVPDCGSIYWSPEEAAFLRICQEKDRFYDEFYTICRQYLNQDDKMLEIVIEAQKDSAPSYEEYQSKEHFAREVLLYGRKSGRILKGDR